MSKKLIKLSPEQERAVDIERNISVSAGAGSGKTRVLTSRFINLLESGIPIESIVAITFTEKAALEMKHRIREVLLSKIETAEMEEKSFWRDKLDKLSLANISTIHGFCSGIVRENAAYTGIDFKFAIINEVDKELKLKEFTEKALSEKLVQDKYKALRNTLLEKYGEDYLSEGIIKDVLNIRNSILNKDGNFEDIFQKVKNSLLGEFILLIVLEVEKSYKEYKLSCDLLDNNDLETMTYEILSNSSISEGYKERYTRFLVDEFQDTNEIQKSIIYFLVTEGGKILPKHLFIVGDFKQSIYGFRGTDYTIFRKVSCEIGEEGKVSLSTCYRSKSEIIGGVNQIFNALIKDYEPLKAPKEETNREKRISIINYKKEKKDENNPYDRVKTLIKSKGGTESEFKAALMNLKDSYSRITMSNSNKDKAVMKAIRLLKDKGLNYKDMCILVRSKYIIGDIESQLKRRNIPYCIIGGRGFYGKEELQMLLLLFEIAVKDFEEPHSVEMDIKVLTILRSFIFNIPDDVLLKIKVEKSENPGLKNYIEACELVIDGMKDSSDKKALNRAYTILTALSKIKKSFSVVGLLKYILEICDIKPLLLSMEGGIQSYRNIEKLLTEAEKFDKADMFSQEGFLDYIKLLDENSKEDSEASLDSEDSDAVKIMTIHQSKGLEFKGVIIPGIEADTLSMSKKEPNRPNLAFYEDTIITKLDLESDNKEETKQYMEYDKQKLIKEVNESIRILYVAMTRAEDYVVLVGEELEEEASAINSPEDMITKLNSFSKALKHVLDYKQAAKEYVECLDFEKLHDLEAEKIHESEKEILDYSKLQERFSFKPNYKPRNTVSASTYMKYCGCPRRFYVENLLNIDPSAYLEEAEETTSCNVIEAVQEQDNLMVDENSFDFSLSGNSVVYKMGVSPSQLGSLVHKILEDLDSNKNKDEDEENIISHCIKEILGDSFEEKQLENILMPVLHRYIDNFKILEKSNNNHGELILNENEVSYLFAPTTDKKMLAAGFIDRLQVFNKNGKLIAVITDYKTNRVKGEESLKHIKDLYTVQLNLYGKSMKELLKVKEKPVDEIILQLYLLDTAQIIEIEYNEAKIKEQLEEMDNSLSKSFVHMDVEEFKKAEGDECHRCRYFGVCRS